MASALSATWLIPGPVVSKSNSRQCINLFSNPFSVHAISHEIDADGNYGPKVKYSTHVGRPASYDQVAAKIFRAWGDIHGYTSAENLSMLAERDRRLGPMRTSYFLFENEDGQNVGIRVFDASDIVFRAETPWPEGSASPSAAPVELSKPGFKLPGRNSGKPFYALELGLLNGDPSLSRGTEYAFTNVASRLDTDYNGGEFAYFGRTLKIKNLDMMIYAQTRAHQVSFFEKYGLKPVLQKNETNELAPVEVASGMILIGATAEDFIEKNFTQKVFTTKKDEAARFDEAQMKLEIKANQEFLTELEKRIISPISLNDFARLEQKLTETLIRAKSHPANSEARNEILFQILTIYFQFVNSVPPQWRHTPNWSNLRKILLSAFLQTSPELSYYNIYLHLSGQAGNGVDMIITPQSEAEFLNRLPVLERWPFGIKKGPLL